MKVKGERWEQQKEAWEGERGRRSIQSDLPRSLLLTVRLPLQVSWHWRGCSAHLRCHRHWLAQETLVSLLPGSWLPFALALFTFNGTGKSKQEYTCKSVSACHYHCPNNGARATKAHGQWSVRTALPGCLNGWLACWLATVNVYLDTDMRAVTLRQWSTATAESPFKLCKCCSYNLLQAQTPTVQTMSQHRACLKWPVHNSDASVEPSVVCTHSACRCQTAFDCH